MRARDEVAARKEAEERAAAARAAAADAEGGRDGDDNAVDVSAASESGGGGGAAASAAHGYTHRDAERCRLMTLLATSRLLSDGESAESLRSAGLHADAFLPVARSYVYLGLPLIPGHARRPPTVDDDGIELARFEPRLKALLQTAMAGKLSVQQVSSTTK